MSVKDKETPFLYHVTRTCVPALVQVVDCSLSLRLPLVAGIYVANKMIPYIVADVKF
jgi:hypothetical protein